MLASRVRLRLAGRTPRPDPASLPFALESVGQLGAQIVVLQRFVQQEQVQVVGPQLAEALGQTPLYVGGSDTGASVEETTRQPRVGTAARLLQPGLHLRHSSENCPDRPLDAAGDLAEHGRVDPELGRDDDIATPAPGKPAELELGPTQAVHGRRRSA